MLSKVAIGVSWMPNSLAAAVYALAALLLVFLFIWVGVGCFLSGTVFSTGRKKLRQVTEIGRVKY